MNKLSIEKEKADPFVVSQLSDAMISAMENHYCSDMTTPSDVLSACFTTLDRVLNGISQIASEEEKVVNRKEIATALQDLLLIYGMPTN